MPGIREAQEAKKELDETMPESAESETIEQKIEAYIATEGLDLTFALAKLRIDLEREFRRILGMRIETQDPLKMKRGFLSAGPLFRKFVAKYPKYEGMGQFRLTGKEPPPYLQYIFFPEGVPKFNEKAPRFLHVLVGIVATLAGVFFMFCGAALAIDAEWSRIPHPYIAAIICLVLAGIRAGFLYLAWRLFAFGRIPNDAA